MDEITLDDKTYVSSKRAAQITGYAKDYVGQLCREGRVQARLVGRNWYVLESSIHDHRFGSAEKMADLGKKIENTANTLEISQKITWESANYSHDVTPNPLPLITPQVESHETVVAESKIEYIPSNKAESVPLSPRVVREMQSAWQDWFTREENILSLADEKEPETQKEQLAEAPYEAQEERFDTEEEIVPIHRSFAVPAVSKLQDQARREVAARMYEPVAERARTFPTRGRVVQRKKSSVLLQASLVLVATAAIIVAVIGTGAADAFFSKNNVQGSPVQYLVGESSFQKP